MSQLESKPGELSKDEVFTILKNPRRRHVIRYLQDNDKTSTVRELTAEVAAIENDVPVEELTYAQRKAVYTSLYQTHLPRLDDAGVIEYDSRSGDVRLADRVEECDAHLRVADGGTVTETASTSVAASNRWAAALVGLAHVNLAVIGGWVFAGGTTGVELLGWLGLLVATVLTVGAWYYWFEVAK